MITLEKGFYGSNVPQMGTYVQNIGIIVTDTNGSMPKDGQAYVIGFYTEDNSVCLDQLHVSDYSLSNAYKVINETIASMVVQVLKEI